MNLAAVAAKYVAHKQSMGMRFRTEARTLKSFCNALGDVTMEDVVGLGPVRQEVINTLRAYLGPSAAK